MLISCACLWRQRGAWNPIDQSSSFKFRRDFCSSGAVFSLKPALGSRRYGEPALPVIWPPGPPVWLSRRRTSR
jgi:hypothetical protein